MPAIHVDDVPGYPAPHSPYSHAVVANGSARAMVRFGADIPGVLVAIEAIALA